MSLMHLVQRKKRWQSTTNSTFQTDPSTFLSHCECVSLLGALISTDVLCFSVTTSSMRSSYLQFISCPLTACQTLKFSLPRSQFGYKAERQHVKIVIIFIIIWGWGEGLVGILSLQFTLNKWGGGYEQRLLSRFNLKDKFKKDKLTQFVNSRGLML